MTRVTQPRRGRAVLALTAGLALMFNPLAGAVSAAPPPKPPKNPNILFFIMDDVGIDQMKVFGYGGVTPPHTPNIDAIARAGVRFRNAWAMSECSPSRSAMVTGRWPLRTNVQAVVSSEVLANSQVSPFEVTVPKILKAGRYESAMFGKFHLAGPQNNPYGNGGPHSLGFDYFHGWIEGEPYPIDTYAGIQPPAGATGPGAYECGYAAGTPAGVCRFASGRCEPATGPRPGLSCITRGGLFDEGGDCGSPPSHDLDFNVANGYYVSPLVINHPDGTVESLPYTDPRARGYRTTLEVNAARDWIRARKRGPWMATVSLSSAHVPFQPPPPELVPPDIAALGTDCTSEAAGRVLSNQTIEAMDREVGRLLVELSLASFSRTGELVYDPSATNTMVVIIGDNGTYAPVVKAPFDPLYSKGTPYQTGVWVPLIIAGPLVDQPDREVIHMVNAADLFALFGEIAGIDVRRAVPQSHVLDATSMLPYLTNPSQPSLRRTNFTQGGTSITKNNETSPPCVLIVEGSPACVELFPSKAVCSDNQGGTWYGPGSPTPYPSCCAVKNSGIYAGEDFKILPPASRAIRNDRFKLLQKDKFDCTSTDPNATVTVTEFYEIDELPVDPRIDRPDGTFANNLLTSPSLPPQGLSPEQLANFNTLYAELQTVLNSEVPCPGDGNLDKVVNNQDLKDWEFFSALSGGQSSWYDFNFDGLTNDADLQVIRQNLGAKCLKQK